MSDLSSKVVLPDATSTAPALCVHENVLVLAWKGSGNDNLNVSVSLDGGSSFPSKLTFSSRVSSSEGPALASSGSRLFIAWKGSGNDNLNVAEVLLSRDARQMITGVSSLGQLDLTFSDTSHSAPALAALNGQFLLCWRGEGGDHINVAKVPHALGA